MQVVVGVEPEVLVLQLLVLVVQAVGEAEVHLQMVIPQQITDLAVAEEHKIMLGVVQELHVMEEQAFKV
jgi:hypothetical protein